MLKKRIPDYQNLPWNTWKMFVALDTFLPPSGVRRVSRSLADLLTPFRMDKKSLDKSRRAWGFHKGTPHDHTKVCGPLELCDIRLVEHFCDQLIQRFERIHATCSAWKVQPSQWRAAIQKIRSAQTSRCKHCKWFLVFEHIHIDEKWVQGACFSRTTTEGCWTSKGRAETYETRVYSLEAASDKVLYNNKDYDAPVSQRRAS